MSADPINALRVVRMYEDDTTKMLIDCIIAQRMDLKAHAEIISRLAGLVDEQRRDILGLRDRLATVEYDLNTIPRAAAQKG